ncbi:hypothetical protein CEUSTIGMA_g9715.t1 [Chlamydomonas eustigma]|uniref:Uncharacterized protein n=1 Tax=Chlamydomonas eustigma TaxID=1157962 RepID=A0A250XGY5_9CHLO|nr:hypothetical protein CEUSTIGMA_g9715.t1 [Chlamydomonas eustigma]|eukprot:GAX82286.1 hypothetical protein CEUSTIGMA_g9715.t1 [Chlamydomonas eustigma]
MISPPITDVFISAVTTPRTTPFNRFALQTITGLAVDTSLPFVQLINSGISAVAVLLSFAFLHSYHTISPKAVFREAMKQLSSSAAVQEVLGAPIVGSPVMLTSVWEGGFYFRDMRLRHRSPRVLMAFEVEGPQRKGLVKLEAKKRKGCHVFKLLAFELRNNHQSKSGSSMVGAVARVFLHGSESVHDKGSGSVLNSMSQPYLETLELDRKFEADDDDDKVKEKLSIIRTAVVGGVIQSAPSSAVQQAASGCAELLKPEKSPSGYTVLVSILTPTS